MRLITLKVFLIETVFIALSFSFAFLTVFSFVKGNTAGKIKEYMRIRKIRRVTKNERKKDISKNNK